jgi:hypothetical protein
LFSATLFAATLQPSLGFAQTPAAPAQSPAFAPNTVIPIELSKSLDAKKLKVGDPVEAKTSADLLNQGQVILARDSKVLGHVTSVKAHTKESADSNIAIAFDHITTKDGHELPLQASIQAVGPPIYSLSATGSPMDSGGMQSPNPPMGAGSSGGSSSGGSMGGAHPSMGGASSSQPSAYPAGVPGAGSSSTGSSAHALSPSSEGVIGLKDLALSASPQASVVSSSSKNVHLDSGTQMLLKIQ